MDSNQLLIYQIFGTSMTVWAIKTAIQVAIIALGVFIGTKLANIGKK